MDENNHELLEDNQEKKKKKKKMSNLERILDQNEKRRLDREQKKREEEMKVDLDSENWILDEIVVKITNKELGNGIYYKLKGVIKFFFNILSFVCGVRKRERN